MVVLCGDVEPLSQIAHLYRLATLHPTTKIILLGYSGKSPSEANTFPKGKKKQGNGKSSAKDTTQHAPTSIRLGMTLGLKTCAAFALAKPTLTEGVNEGLAASAMELGDELLALRAPH